MNIVINPGSGPAWGATEGNATANMQKFTSDLTERGIPATFARRPDADYGEGRYAFMVTPETGVAQEVQMPGLPLDRVRWLGPEQDIWQFPRLYVDGGSWIWFFALNAFENEGVPNRAPDGSVRGGEPYQFSRVTAAGEAGASDDD